LWYFVVGAYITLVFRTCVAKWSLLREMGSGFLQDSTVCWAKMERKEDGKLERGWLVHKAEIRQGKAVVAQYAKGWTPNNRADFLPGFILGGSSPLFISLLLGWEFSSPSHCIEMLFLQGEICQPLKNNDEEEHEGEVCLLCWV
jgi:hypothetical protein